MAQTLKRYLDSHHVSYETVHHRRTVSASRTAQAAHVPGDTLAKTVVLKDDRGNFIIAVVPATHRLDIGKLDRQMHRTLGLATESELAGLFRDCDLGAIPPVGAAYGVETVVDDSISELGDIYFEAGDHEDLVHMSSEQFHLLMAGQPHYRFSHHV
jgi:Ala-tRNA(Pro) deacylase